MPRFDRRRTTAASFLTLCLCVGALSLLVGCGKKEPEPTVPGYYTGPIKPKGEVAPGPANQAKPGQKGGAATGE